MDNLTHTLIGVTVANAGLRRTYGRGTTLALAVASNIPDLDVFWGFLHDGPSFAYRRMLTHAAAGLPVLAAIGAFVHWRFYRHRPFRSWFFLYLLGAALHVVFDLANSYGVAVLYPFSRRRFEFASLFIVDLTLLVFLLMPLLLSRLGSPWTRIEDLSRIAVRCVVIYVGACVLLHHRAGLALQSFIVNAEMRPSFSYVFPEALGPQRFRGVVREEDTYRIYRIGSVGGRVAPVGRAVTEDDHPDVARILQTADGRRLAWFMKAPVWQSVPGAAAPARRWTVRDLRFESTVIRKGNPFVYAFDVTDAGVDFLGRGGAGAARR